MNKLSQYCGHVVEFGWLLVLAAIPLFLNLNTTQVYETDKVGLFRSIVLVMTLAWLMKAAAGGTNERQPGWREEDEDDIDGDDEGPGGLLGLLRRFPVESALIAFAAVQIIATIGSIAPALSFKGTYYRAQGVQTLVAWVSFALLIAAELKTSRQLERLVSVSLLTSMAAAWYGIAQMQGLEPTSVEGHGLYGGRAVASMGNPIWFGAYLVTVIPLAAWRLVRALYDWRTRRQPPAVRRGPGAWSWGLAIVGAVLPLVWVWLYMNYLGWGSGRFGAWWALGSLLSIGAFVGIFLAPIGDRIRPWLRAAGFAGVTLLNLGALVIAASRGPAVGIVVAALALAIIAGLRFRQPRIWRSAAVLTVLGAVFVVLVNVPGSPLANLQRVPMLGRILAFQTEGQLPAGGRFLIWGSAFQLIVAPVDGDGNGVPVPTALRPLIGYGPDTFVDIFQRVESPALANSTSRIIVFDRAHSQYVDVLVQSGLLGLLAYIGFIAGAVWVGLRALWRTNDPYRLMFLLAVTSGLIGHAVEAQSGLQNMATEVNLAAYLAMLAAAGHVVTLGAGRRTEPAREPAAAPPEREPLRVESPPRVPAGVAGITGSITRGRTARAGSGRRPVQPAAAESAELVLGVWPAERLVWGGVYLGLLVLALGLVSFVNTPQAYIIPAAILALSPIPIMLMGGGLLRAGEPGLVRIGPALDVRAMAWWAVLALVAVLAPSFIYWNVVPVAADALYKKAVAENNKVLALPETDVLNRGRLQVQALLAYRDVVDALPLEDFYYLPLGQSFFQMGMLRAGFGVNVPFTVTWEDAMTTPIQTLAVAGRPELLEAARAVYEGAVEVRPSSAEYHSTVARHYVNMARYNGDAGAPTVAVEFYKEAIERAPYNVIYRLELAELYGSMARFDDALAEADGALKQDPVFWRGHFVRSLALARLERLDEAIAECQIAIQNLGRSFEAANSQEQEGVQRQWDTLQEWQRTGTKPF